MNQVTTEFRSPETDKELNSGSKENADDQLIAIADRSTTSQKLRPRSPAQESQEWLIRKILVPTDFSRASTKAIKRAVALAGQCDALLTFLHVIDINAQGEPGTAKDLMNRLWNDGSSRMAQLVCSLSGQVEAQTMIAEGLPCEVIIEKSGEFDLVVIAESSGERSWKLFSKHTARRVIENAACPVMTVHDRVEASA